MPTFRLAPFVGMLILLQAASASAEEEWTLKDLTDPLDGTGLVATVIGNPEPVHPGDPLRSVVGYYRLDGADGSATCRYFQKTRTDGRAVIECRNEGEPLLRLSTTGQPLGNPPDRRDWSPEPTKEMLASLTSGLRRSFGLGSNPELKSFVIPGLGISAHMSGAIASFEVKQSGKTAILKCDDLVSKGKFVECQRGGSRSLVDPRGNLVVSDCRLIEVWAETNKAYCGREGTQCEVSLASGPAYPCESRLTEDWIARLKAREEGISRRLAASTGKEPTLSAVSETPEKPESSTSASAGDASAPTAPPAL